MEELFENLFTAEYLEETFDSIDNKPLQEYYALFISAMAYHNYLVLSEEFAAKLYIVILNSEMANKDELLENIFEFLVNKEIDQLEKEINE